MTIKEAKDMTYNELKTLAFDLRKDVLDMICKAKTGHIGGDFSVLEILVTLYFKQMNIGTENETNENRDRFIMSKGHSMEAYYAVLAAKGFLDIKEVIDKFSTFGSPYIGHPNNKLPGIEMNSGSLGHGLPVSVGMALAGRMQQKDYRVYVVMGDGELAEGSVWEGVMAAGHYKLSNLCAVVDFNGLQISGPTKEVMNHENLKAQFESFGWNAISVKGNDIKALDEAFTSAKNEKERPTVVIANTIKAFGMSFAENRAEWHHKIPTAAEYEQAIAELAQRKKEVSYE